ncbi:MAG: CoA-binding protein [Chloroflexota bacterium]|nr:CoA-binding protein [Chloroflexota bacterium]
MAHDLDSLFYPESIAFIGVSMNAAKFGGGFWTKVVQKLGYSGNIYPVGPKEGEFSGLKVYKSVSDIPGKVDLAIMSIPAQITPQIMRECAEKGVKYVHLYTAGFSETGEQEGIDLENQLLQAAQCGDVRVVGPNCMGVYCPSSGISWRIDFPRESGPLGVIAQSGWNAVEIIKLGASRKVYCSEAVSYGNASDLNEADFIDYFSSDPNTKVVGMYIEGVRDGRRFLSNLKNTAIKKPVVILKGGRTNAGTRAVASHTSSLAGTMQIWNAAMKQTGAIAVQSFDELLDTVVACLYMPIPQNRNVGVIGSGGGPSVTAADDCESAGLNVPPFPEDLRQYLSTLMPKEGTSCRNPLDSPFWWEPDKFSAAVRAIADASEFGSVILHAEIDSTVLFVHRDIVTMMSQAMIYAAKNCGKPAACVLRTTGTPEAQQILREEQERFINDGLPLYPSLARAAKAMSNLISYGEWHSNAII